MLLKLRILRLHSIEIEVPGFIIDPPPEGTHQVELPNQPTIEEKVIFSDSTQEEEAVRVFEVIYLEEEFEVFDRPDLVESSITTPRPLPSAQISSNQETTDILEAMVLQRKNTSLLELLESHAIGSTPEVVVQPRAPTPLPTRTSPTESLEKKRKREKKGGI